MRPLLKYGDTGEHVKALQSILRSQGFFDGAIGGNFLRKTKAAVVYWQQTHVGENGKPLSVDGIVGPATWWSLENPSGSAQRNNIHSKVPSGLDETRNVILETALKEHGNKEIPDGSNRGDGVDKYIEGFGPAPWCCLFYSWVLKQATGEYPLGRRHAHVLTFWRAAKAVGKAFYKSKYTPVPGDAFIMLYKNKSGALTGSGHIGFVLRVSDDGKRFNTIEGNAGNRVKVGLRSVSESSIIGFVNLHGSNSTYERGVLEGYGSEKSTR